MIIRNLMWPDDEENLMAHIRLVHGGEDLEYLSIWYGSAPAFDPADCFVVEDTDTGAIIAHAMINPRRLQIGQSELPTAEIAVVGVQEDYRRQGVARALLDTLHERMDERNDALGLIFGIPNFYERWHYDYGVGLYLTSFESEIETGLALGAARWDVEHSYERRTAERLGARNRPVIVRRFYLGDLPAVMDLYYHASQRGEYMVARDEKTWQWQLDYLARIGRYEPDDFLVAEVDGRLVAYARMVTRVPINWFRGPDAARVSVIEAAGDHPDAVSALLGAVAETAQALAVERIGLFVHPDSPFMQHALARGARRAAFTGAGFLRVHNLQLALDLMRPTLEDRRLNSRYTARAYYLYVTTEHDSAVVSLGMGDDPEAVDLEIPSTSFARLLTGWYGIDQIEIGYHERYRGLLSVLFPRRDPKIGFADLM